MAFAGIWRPWTGVRGTKAEPVEGEHLLKKATASKLDQLSCWSKRPLIATLGPLAYFRNVPGAGISHSVI
jgi:hypothetical protein